MSNMVSFYLTSRRKLPILTSVAKMISGLEQVRKVLGDEDASGLSDQTLKDTLWDCFFDVDKTIQWAIG
jgi:HBS1 N-terminus